MTMFPTPRQIADTQRAMDEMTIQAKKERIELLERLIQKYAAHVGCIEGVSYLEDRYRGMFGGGNIFASEEWAEIRRIAKESE